MTDEIDQDRLMELLAALGEIAKQSPDPNKEIAVVNDAVVQDDGSIVIPNHVRAEHDIHVGDKVDAVFQIEDRG